jgi:hypothetical protein
MKEVKQPVSSEEASEEYANRRGRWGTTSLCTCKMRRSNYPSDIDPYTRIVNPDCDIHGKYA